MNLDGAEAKLNWIFTAFDKDGGHSVMIITMMMIIIIIIVIFIIIIVINNVIIITRAELDFPCF